MDLHIKTKVSTQLDAVVAYMPSPLDIPAMKGQDVDTGEEMERHPMMMNHLPHWRLRSTDPFVGKLCFFRVYSGILRAGSYVLNLHKDKKERIGRILQMHANHREEIED